MEIEDILVPTFKDVAFGIEKRLKYEQYELHACVTSIKKFSLN